MTETGERSIESNTDLDAYIISQLPIVITKVMINTISI